MRLPPPEPVPQSETVDVLRPVLLHASALPGAFVWRENSGLYYTRSGRRVRASIPGCADIIGMVSLSVARLQGLGIERIGAFLAIEAKTFRGKPEPSQLEFRAAVQQRHGLYLVARSPADVDAQIGEML